MYRLCYIPGEMVRQARILAQATSDLVGAIKADAEQESDLENSRKLLSAAKLLADATARMVEAAKVGPGRPRPCSTFSCLSGWYLIVLSCRAPLLTRTARSNNRSYEKPRKVCA